MMGWGKKKESKADDNGVNWKQIIVETNATVLSYGERFNAIEDKQKICHKETSEGRRELREHCDDEVKDRAALKDHICKKIEERGCPEEDVIKEIQRNGKDKGTQMEGLATTVTGYKESVDAFVTEIRNGKAQKEGEKKAFKKIMVRSGYILAAISSITGIVTKIVGVW